MRHHEQSLGRRRFLAASALAASSPLLRGLVGLGGAAPLFRQAIAGELQPQRKVLYIFLRGALDGVQCVIPYGDQGAGADRPDYLTARPTIGVPREDAHELSSFAGLHPSLQGPGETDPRVLDMFRGEIDARGANLALVHRVGYANQNRSHFSSQQFHENAVPGAVRLEEGWLNRYLTAYVDEDAPLTAVSIANNQLVALKGETLVPAIANVDDYDLPANAPLGNFASLENPLGSGLKGSYSQSGFDGRRAYERLTYETGQSLLDNIQYFRDEVFGVPYAPTAAAAPYYDAISDAAFRSRVRDCARLLKQVPSCRIAACNQDGFDTHGNEPARFNTLMRDLGLALTALYFDLEDIWDDTVIVCPSEFGRTSLENGNRGTDHAESTVHVLAGGRVRGGLYNCDAGSWANGDLFSTANGRYLAHRTDFRSLLAELVGHLGDPGSHLDTVIPGYSQLVANDAGGYFTPLGIIQS